MNAANVPIADDGQAGGVGQQWVAAGQTYVAIGAAAISEQMT
jgi:hypothetical protein